MVETLKPTRALAGIAGQYTVNTGLLLKAFSDFKDDDLFRQPQGGNSLHWIAGHVTDSRLFIGELAGLGTKSTWGKLFEFGCEIQKPDAYPAIDKILSLFEDTGEKLLSRFGEMSDEELTKPVEPNFPGQDKTVFGAIAFLSLHESFHVGQLSYVRRLLGYSGLAG